MQKLSRDEIETVITFNDADLFATVYTNNKSWIKKLDKHVDSLSASIISSDEYSKTYRFDKKSIKIRPPRVLSDAEKEIRRLNIDNHRKKMTKKGD